MREAYLFKNARIYVLLPKLMFVRPHRTKEDGLLSFVANRGQSILNKLLSALNIAPASRCVTLLSHEKSKLTREHGLMSATNPSQMMAPTDWPVLMIVCLYSEQHALHTSRSHKED